MTPNKNSMLPAREDFNDPCPANDGVVNITGTAAEPNKFVNWKKHALRRNKKRRKEKGRSVGIGWLHEKHSVYLNIGIITFMIFTS